MFEGSLHKKSMYNYVNEPMFLQLSLISLCKSISFICIDGQLSLYGVEEQGQETQQK